MNLLQFILICVLVHVGLLRVWFDTELFSDVQEFLAKYREDDSTFGLVCRMLSCWQCFGVWMGWLVVFVLARHLPDAPVFCENIVLVLLLGPAVGFLSELVEYYIVSELRK